MPSCKDASKVLEWPVPNTRQQKLASHLRMLNFTVPGDRRLCYCSTYDSERTMGMGEWVTVDDCGLSLVIVEEGRTPMYTAVCLCSFEKPFKYLQMISKEHSRIPIFLVNASWMESVSVFHCICTCLFECRCEDPNNLNDQIQGPCNDAAAGPNGSLRHWHDAARLLESRLLLEETESKAVGCRTMNRSMRMHEPHHLGFHR